jgi:hypothetical protein
MTPPVNARVIAQGRYIGKVIEAVPVQNEHGYSTAYRIHYQRECSPNTGWFLARDIETWKGAA